MAAPDTHNFAVFCDFENMAIGLREGNYPDFKIRPVLERLLLKGSIVVKKAYCDWDRYKEYKRDLNEAAFELIEIPHVRQSGKNSADIPMPVSPVPSLAERPSPRLRASRWRRLSYAPFPLSFSSFPVLFGAFRTDSSASIRFSFFCLYYRQYLGQTTSESRY